MVYHGLLTWNNFGLVFVFDKGQLADAGRCLVGVGVESEEWGVLSGLSQNLFFETLDRCRHAISRMPNNAK